MKKLAIIALALASYANAEQVYFSAHGKTFHKSEHCMALSRATHIYSADRAEALAHKLHECGICFRVHKASKQPEASAVGWAKEVK